MVSLVERIADLRERTERRSPVTAALLANFEPGKRHGVRAHPADKVAFAEILEVVGTAMGLAAVEGETPAYGWRRTWPKAVGITARTEAGRLFQVRIGSRANGIPGLRWRADAPEQARVAAVLEAADRRRYGL